MYTHLSLLCDTSHFRQIRSVKPGVSSRHLNLTDDLLRWLAECTGGFLPCDLLALCRSAALLAVRSAMNAEVEVKKEHFQKLGRGGTFLLVISGGSTNGGTSSYHPFIDVFPL